MAWVQQVAGESPMEMEIPDLATQTGAMADIVNITEVAILLKAGIAMAYRLLLPKKSADLHGDEMMAVHQDCHQDHHLLIIMMEDRIVQMGIDLAHESLTAHRKEVGEVHRTWTRIYPAMAQTAAEETIDADGMTVMTVGTMIEGSGNVIEDWTTMIEVEVP